jgi:hypothetical protein
MMNADIARAARRIRRYLSREDGISIIEVLAATLIFLMLSVGVAQATVTAIRLAGDQRHRITALSLAASEIDLVRSMTNPFDVLTRTPPLVRTIDGLDYTIHRTTSWVSGTGLDIPCGAGGTGNLQYKRVNVRVTWEGQLEPVAPVSSDTILAPDGRINDPERGTIIVAATRADGTGAAGVSVNISPNGSGAVALDAQPDPTNAEGCTYALQVTPGTYTVALSRANYVDSNQQSTASTTVTVEAGKTINTPFTYDAAATFGVTFAGGVAASRATNFNVSYVNTYGIYQPPLSSGATAKLFPWSSGYRAIGGDYVAPDGSGNGGCPVLDPSEWTSATVSGTVLGAGIGTDPVAAAPGGTATMDVPLGVVRINDLRRDRYVTAVNVGAPAVPGQPSCAEHVDLTFSRISSSGSSEDRYILLPYGTWRLYTGTSSGSKSSSVSGSDIVPLTNVVTTGMVTGNQVTVDPRPAG